jgi:hypothetical protein
MYKNAMPKDKRLTLGLFLMLNCSHLKEVAVRDSARINRQRPGRAVFSKEEMGHIASAPTRPPRWRLKEESNRKKFKGASISGTSKPAISFGRSDSGRSNRYCHWGAKTAEQYSTRWEFKKEVDPLIQQMGLAVPDPIAGRQYL